MASYVNPSVRRFCVICGVLMAFILMGIFLTSCSSSGPKVQTQKYAELRSERVFEHEFPVVWGAIEETFRKHRIKERDPKKVSSVEMKKISERSLETDWIYSQSKDKYITYKVNESPRKKYLQTRFKYELIAKRSIAGVKVRVEIEEEIQRLNPDGSPDGFDEVDRPDSSRASAVLDQIKQSITQR